MKIEILRWEKYQHLIADDFICVCLKRDYIHHLTIPAHLPTQCVCLNSADKAIDLDPFHVQFHL